MYTFLKDKILDENKREIMMEWETPIMKEHAKIVTENGGDILEIGFGMGISAGYIQSHSINSHTIVENHPEIIPRAQAWASNKSNVNIITGSWYDIRSNLSTYDGVFYDTFGDDDWNQFGVELPNLVKANAKATWWNNNSEESNIHNIEGVSYEAINVNPPTNDYFNHEFGLTYIDNFLKYFSNYKTSNILKKNSKNT